MSVAAEGGKDKTGTEQKVAWQEVQVEHLDKKLSDMPKLFKLDSDRIAQSGFWYLLCDCDAAGMFILRYLRQARSPTVISKGQRDTR